jgi:hypothetical protein
LDALGRRLLRRSGLGLLDSTLSHYDGYVVERGAVMRAASAGLTQRSRFLSIRNGEELDRVIVIRETNPAIVQSDEDLH